MMAIKRRKMRTQGEILVRLEFLKEQVESMTPINVHATMGIDVSELTKFIEIVSEMKSLIWVLNLQ